MRLIELRDDDALLVSPLTLMAQETTSSVRGTIVSGTGDPVAGASVAVIDTRTGNSRTLTTDSDGSFNVRGLVIGVPYEIQVSAETFKGALVEDVFINLGQAATYTIPLETGAIEEVVVTASAQFAGADIAIGPGSTFGI